MLAAGVNVLGIALFACTIAFVVSVIALKRKDVSWRELLAAGPLAVILRPREYFIEGRHKIPTRLYWTAMLFGVALFAVGWLAANTN